MAIDTKDKRFNMLSVASPIAWALLPDPDSSIDANDRGQLLHLYAGNTLDNPTAPTVTLIAQARGSHRAVFSRVFGRVN